MNSKINIMMKIVLARVVIIVLLFQSTITGHGQSENLGVSLPSANAGGLGLYTEMPVSYFTGIPSISIPLFEMKGNKISLPISMSYHAGGLRPELHPGWVGNGWSLEAGGVITRKMNGQSDERQRLGQGMGKSGYYYNTQNLNNSTWNSQAQMVNGVYQNVIPSGNSSLYDCDTEPDEFDFNFLGVTGKFFLDQTKNWQVQSESYLKVIFDEADLRAPFTTHISGPYDPNNISPTFGKFTIIDAKGNKYIFGSLDNFNTAIEFSDVMRPSPADGFGNTIVATSWYLTQIVSADETEVINLTYERGPLTCQLGFSSAWGGFTTPGVNTGFNWTIPANFSSACTVNVNSVGISGWIQFPVYLTSISMPCKNLFVDFTGKSKSDDLKYIDDLSSNDDYLKMLTHVVVSDGSATTVTDPLPSDFPSAYAQNAQVMATSNVIPYYNAHYDVITNSTNNFSKRFIWLKLDGITVRNSVTNATIRSITFNYNNDPQKRLQLVSLNIRDKNEQAVQNYSFGYNNSTPLPQYLRTLTDHWGFHNNFNFTGQAPSFGIDYTQDFYQRRSPDPTGIYTKAEILTSITFPTGGQASFGYEPNTYSSVVYRDPLSTYLGGTIPKPETGIGGGLRISQIDLSDGSGNTMTKNFYYVKNYIAGADPATLPSSGVLDTKPVYKFLNQGTLSNGGIMTNQLIASNPVIPTTSNSSSTLIGYTQVIEKQSDGSYTFYEYTNHDNGYNDQLQTASTYSLAMTDYPPTSLAFERGKLIREASYEVNAGQQRLISENLNTYASVQPTYYTDPLVSANALYDRASVICGNAVEWRRSAYFMYSFPFVPTVQTEKVYSMDGSGTNIAKTTTLTYDLYKNVVAIEGTNSKGQLERIEYKYPYHFSSSDPLNPYALMVEMNKISEPVEKRILIGNYLVRAELYTYKIYSAKKVLRDAVYVFETGAPVLSSSVGLTYYVNGGTLGFDSRYKKQTDLNYDNAGNISSVTKPGNSNGCYLWDYQLQLPVAKVENASNIYGTGSANNSVVSVSYPVYMSGTPYITVSTNVVVAATGSNGSLTISFAYSNPYISGNNSSVLSYSLQGITNPSYYSNGSLCAATMSASCSYGTNSAVVTGLTAGSYVVRTTIVSVTGFQNYYGYAVNLSYQSYKYPLINSQNDIAFTSFEYQNSNELNFGSGNFSGIVFGNIQQGSVVTGNRSYTFNGSIISKTGLDPTKTYIVSYWSNSGSYTVSSSQSVTQGASLNPGNWQYFEHVVTNTSLVNISGAGSIDELRIYPTNSWMTTYTYDPVVGLTSECDINNRLVYYEYDSFNRLSIIRDQDKNILKKICYSYNNTGVICN
jgi:hypothetical protein